MITAQDIREKTFEKARIGGYEMTSVDDFLEELADEITAAQKENTVLKSKMKVLVDKIEEYRANEEALNLAVLSAQKLAVQIESDARTRAAAMIADADRQVKAQLTEHGCADPLGDERRELRYLSVVLQTYGTVGKNIAGIALYDKRLTVRVQESQRTEGCFEIVDI